MAKSERIDFGGVNPDIKARGGYLSPGDYLVKITGVEKKWKDNDRSNVPYFSWKFQSVDGNTKGTIVFQNTSLATDALFNLRNLIHAVTKKNVAGKAVNFDPQKFVGKRLAITTEDREYKPPGKAARMVTDVVDMRPADELETDSDDDDEETEEVEEEEVEEEDEDLEEVDVEDL